MLDLFFFSGKNPKKINFSEKPLIDTAVETAEGPGIGVILILFLTHSFTNIAPGSEILGVPASDINEIIFLDLRRSMILFKFFDSLNLWFEIRWDFIWYLSNRILETLVSSQRIYEDFFNVSIALKVIQKDLIL